jgi:hypothetical protein
LRADEIEEDGFAAMAGEIDHGFFGIEIDDFADAEHGVANVLADVVLAGIDVGS